MKVYFIPGLGADKRIFKYIKLPTGFEPHYADWLPPNVNESLHDYAKRLSTHFDTSEPFIVVGLSFGGMLASEIVSMHEDARAVLISSVSNPAQLPVFYRLAGKIRLHKLLPISLLKSAALLKRLFTAETPEQKSYLRKMIAAVDVNFIKWAIDAIVNWRTQSLPSPTLHIHGSRDEILPVSFCKPTHVIKGAGHMMVLTRAQEINRILDNYLSQS